MNITPRQIDILDNLDRIVIRTVGRRPVAILDGEDCGVQLISLCTKGLVASDADRGWIKVAGADGIGGAARRRAPGGRADQGR